jgi:hypothetical protein
MEVQITVSPGVRLSTTATAQGIQWLAAMDMLLREELPRLMGETTAFIEDN